MTRDGPREGGGGGEREKEGGGKTAREQEEEIPEEDEFEDDAKEPPTSISHGTFLAHVFIGATTHTRPQLVPVGFYGVERIGKRIQ